MDTVIQGSNSGVTVIGGDNSRPGVAGGSRDGVKGGKPGAKGKVKNGTGKAPAGPATGTGKSWAPKGELYIAQLPRALKAVKLECPAVRDLGISGEVVLRVQVRNNGSVRSVKVLKGIGNGCDEIAAKALRKTKFKPAVGTDGKKYDFEIKRYIYEYKRAR
jgi:protein TonB